MLPVTKTAKKQLNTALLVDWKDNHDGFHSKATQHYFTALQQSFHYDQVHITYESENFI